MKIINSGGVYTYILGELEWYSRSDRDREATIVNCTRMAERMDCRYAAIIVEPDAVMSISPIVGRHQVWRHTFPTSEEVAFRHALQDAYGTSKLDALRKAAIAREVFEL